MKVAQSCPTLRPHRLYHPWNSPGQNTGVGSLSLLQGIFPTQGLSPGLPHCRQILYQMSHKGSPRILKWVAYPFSSGSSRTRVCCIAGRFFTNWAIREAHIIRPFAITFILGECLCTWMSISYLSPNPFLFSWFCWKWDMQMWADDYCYLFV